MIDEDLLEELDAAVTTMGDVQVVPEDEASEWVKKLADAFVANRARRWWWESLTKPSKHIGYGDADGLAILAALVAPESSVALVVTDDSDPPWPVYLGAMVDIIKVLRGCRLFEYFVASHDGSWIVFDTHMNELIVAGELAR